MTDSGELHHVMFVCSGNICRSPMAEGFAARLRPDLIVTSAATDPMTGWAPTHEAQVVMREVGIDIGDLRSSGLFADRLASADVVYCMTAGHVATVQRRHPEAADKIQRLIPDADISDPYGYDLDEYRRVRDLIQAAVRDRLAPTSRESGSERNE